jgi:membrane-bound metal-dependent hydrolase YbcI (DUF457 family)
LSSPVGHILGATIVYTAIAERLNLPTLRRRHYVGLTVLALLPDVDVLFLSQVGHRTSTHGIIGTCIVALGFYLLLQSAARTAVRKRALAAGAILCAAAHPVMDTLACPSRPIWWFAPFSQIQWSFDPIWTVLPQPYFYIVDGGTYYLPMPAILAGIPQVVAEILIYSGMLAWLHLRRRREHSPVVRHVPLVIAAGAWLVWRTWFPTIWME